MQKKQYWCNPLPPLILSIFYRPVGVGGNLIGWFYGSDTWTRGRLSGINGWLGIILYYLSVAFFLCLRDNMELICFMYYGIDCLLVLKANSNNIHVFI